MTERGPFTGMRGAPGPAEPSSTGDPPATATGPQQIPGLPADLGAVRRTDAIIDSLSARRAAGTAARSTTGAETGAEGCAEGCRPRQADEPDPAVRLLRALITDVDEAPEAGADTTPAPPSPPAPGSGPRRRGPRTIVALGVAGAVLASTGVAAAGDGVSERGAAAPVPASTGVSGDVEKPISTDSDAGFHDDWRAVSVPGASSPVRVVPVRVVPDPVRQAARRPPAERREYDPTRSRPRHLYPHQTPSPSENAPVTPAYSPTPRPEDTPSSPPPSSPPPFGPAPSSPAPPSGTPGYGRPPSGDLGEPPEKRPDQYKYRRHHDHRHNDHQRRG
ncbi:hypothetical protein GCM10022254_47330 [Actinomadura meridiana]|uniref:Uncharacterized protein n=1 Tax=Actinomadura meridiana TaxID=559626 RepID=A0ABP8CAY9_9ACTN